jgi:Ca2+:H+ antiporter
MKYLRFLLVFIPISFILTKTQPGSIILFCSICLSIIPLAALIGDATEQITIYTGSKIGGLVNATMGNIPELFIGFFAVRAGLYNLVIASMAGSIISNILLVLGMSILLGGLKQKYQTFDKNIARSNFLLLFFTAMSVVIPFALQYVLYKEIDGKVKAGLTAISLVIAVMLFIIYISGLFFSLVTHRNVFIKHEEHEEEAEKAKWSLLFSVIALAVTSVLVAVESEMLVSVTESMIKNYGAPEVFLGIIILPILGNVAEHASAIMMAVRNKVDVSVEIAIGSSIQIALFVVPVLILISFILGNPIIYVYDAFELVAILISIALSLYIFQDGKTNWLEGLVLMSSYILLGVAFYFI